MKILTWNMNGIRAVTRDKTLKELLDSLEADVMCFQETKVTRDMLEEATCMADGYNAYFSFSRVKTGYSGVATFCKQSATPCAAEEGLTSLLSTETSIGCYGDTDDFTPDKLLKLDSEGRTVLTEHLLPSGNKVAIINVYCPRADMENEDRIQFKLEFHKLLARRVEALLESGKHVIVLGDINAAHKPIDHCNPGKHEDFSSYPGRAWLDELLIDLTEIKSSLLPATDATVVTHLTPDQLATPVQLQASNSSVLSDDCSTDGWEGSDKNKGGLLADSFRYFHPTQKEAYTNWSTTTGARQTNYGTRIDYILGDLPLIQHEFTDCVVRPDIEGSDHCPVVCTLRSDFIPASKPPGLCTKYMPEFAGKQQKLGVFFSKKAASTLFVPLPGKSVHLTNEKERTASEELAIKEYVSKKRSASVSSSSSNSSSKRPKTAQSAKPNSLLQFFGQNTSKPKSTCNLQILESKVPLVRGDSGFGDTENQSEQFENGSQSNSQELPLSGQSSFSSGSAESTPSSSEGAAKVSERKSEVATWKSILKGPAPAPLCPGHNEPSVLRTVKKKGPNYGRQFYCCARPEGHASNKDASCKFFKWLK